MKTIENIKKVSLIFFVITGIIHFTSGIFIANEIFLKEAGILNKTMDIPFILTGLIYGFSSLRISLTNPTEKHKILDISLLSVIILILIGIIAINLIFPELET